MVNNDKIGVRYMAINIALMSKLRRFILVFSFKVEAMPLICFFAIDYVIKLWLNVIVFIDFFKIYSFL